MHGTKKTKHSCLLSGSVPLQIPTLRQAILQSVSVLSSATTRECWDSISEQGTAASLHIPSSIYDIDWRCVNWTLRNLLYKNKHKERNFRGTVRS
jgi:hypothetical protein